MAGSKVLSLKRKDISTFIGQYEKNLLISWIKERNGRDKEEIKKGENNRKK